MEILNQNDEEAVLLRFIAERGFQGNRNEESFFQGVVRLLQCPGDRRRDEKRTGQGHHVSSFISYIDIC